VLRTRVWTALIALPTLLAIIFFAPPIAFTVFIIALTAIGLYEIAAMNSALRAPSILLIVILGAGSTAAVFQSPESMEWLSVLIFVTMATIMTIVGFRGGQAAPRGTSMAFFGALWVGGLFPYFALLRNSPGGVALTILVLILVVVSDSAAYFTGSWLGRTKLAPRISPNKTVEGAAGALVGCAIAGLALRGALVPAWSIGRTLVASIVICALAQIGDLIGSSVKRAAGVKDSGWIFPGHGGLLDRTCSLVFATAFTFYYNDWLIRGISNN